MFWAVINIEQIGSKWYRSTVRSFFSKKLEKNIKNEKNYVWKIGWKSEEDKEIGEKK